MRTVAIVLAAGQGKRMGAGVNKQFLPLAGRPVLWHTLTVFERCAAVEGVIVVAHQDELDYCRENILSQGDFRKVLALTAGGAERQDSVWQGLQALPDWCDTVAVHDGARPLVTADAVAAAIAAVTADTGVALGVPVKDTIKQTDEAGLVRQTLPRQTLWSVQTPQVFARAQLWDSCRRAMAEGWYGTDDASLVERYGGRVRMLLGSYENLKLTTAEDMLTAEGILRRRQEGGTV